MAKNEGAMSEPTTKEHRDWWVATIRSPSESGKFLLRLIADVERLEAERDQLRQELDNWVRVAGSGADHD